jgi:hypothetical protein
MFMRMFMKVLVPIVHALGGEFYGPHITSNGEKIDCVTLHLFDKLPRKTTLIDFDGNRVQRWNVPSRDTRRGFLAYGLPSQHAGMRVYIGKRRYK